MSLSFDDLVELDVLISDRITMLQGNLIFCNANTRNCSSVTINNLQHSIERLEFLRSFFAVQREVQ